MRWVCSKEESEYMQMRQKQNRAHCKFSSAENWMHEKLMTTPYKWTRQARWGYRLFDFWCHELGTAVEVDGPEHNKNYDEARDKYNYLRSAIVVLRVKNFDEADSDAALVFIGRAESWGVRKILLNPGKKLLTLHGLQMARSAKDKLGGAWER